MGQLIISETVMDACGGDTEEMCCVWVQQGERESWRGLQEFEVVWWDCWPGCLAGICLTRLWWRRLSLSKVQTRAFACVR